MLSTRRLADVALALAAQALLAAYHVIYDDGAQVFNYGRFAQFMK